jgi:hypothetical protein
VTIELAIPDDLTPRDAPGLLRELSPDVRAALLLDAAGALVADSEDDPEQAEELAERVRQLVAVADSAAGGEPPEQLEVQVEAGTVFAARDPGHLLAAVTRRSALSSLMFYDMRALLAALRR